jgi:toxin ParE2
MTGILKAAQQELDEAFVYYESQVPGLGSEFIEEFEKAAQRIEQFPEAWHPFSSHTRRCQLNRFPYGIIYHFDETGVVILAIAHLHRKPNYWRERLKNP